MASYVFDGMRGSLLVVWGTGIGDRAGEVVILPDAVEEGQALALGRTLTDLSVALWRTYTHPPEAAASLEMNSEGWRREETRKGLSEVPAILLAPNLPSERGELVVCYDPVEEAAHRVGRALHVIGDEAVSQAIVAEVGVELDAIGRAGLGDLTGRAAHAVTLTRAGASPVQVAAADAMLRDNPLGGVELFTTVDPAAAAVAAAHWLQAAADVAERVSGVPAVSVVIEADNIEAVPHETPTAVLGLMEISSPHDAVMMLIEQAMVVAEGGIPNVDELRDSLSEAERLAASHGPGDPELMDGLMAAIRLTPLDPSRPAQDLLEDLLSGIYACLLLYREYADDDSETPLDDRDDAFYDALSDRVEEAFLNAVRAEADDAADRLA